MKTIRITGKGNIRLRPDTTRITIGLEGVFPEYSETAVHSAADTENLKKIVEKLGFARTDLKTLRFDIRPEFESYKEKGVYKNRLIGYKYSHIMKLEFDPDNTLLGKTLSALSDSDVHPDLSIDYTVKDPEAVKNKLLGKAVSDAREKAEVLTKAAGVPLKDIQSIDYSWGKIDIDISRSVVCAAPMCLGEDMAAPDIEPDDIELSDNVTVTWEIG